MNLILFETHELAHPLPRTDRRAKHLVEVLKRHEGDVMDVGLVNGPRGRATVSRLTNDAVELVFDWGPTLPARPALTLIVGLPRPQTARDILRDATTLGVTGLHFVATDKGEPGYALSNLWSEGEWRRLVLAGAEQAFDPRLPDVTYGKPLAEVLPKVSEPSRWALDNYESSGSLGALPAGPNAGIALAIGPERGWSQGERQQFLAAGFTFHHLGERVLRTETAVTAALAIVLAKQGRM